MRVEIAFVSEMFFMRWDFNVGMQGKLSKVGTKVL